MANYARAVFSKICKKNGTANFERKAHGPKKKSPLPPKKINNNNKRHSKITARLYLQSDARHSVYTESWGFFMKPVCGSLVVCFQRHFQFGQ